MAEGVGLTKREERVLELLARGKVDVEVANELAIPFDDAKRGVQTVMRKVGANSREEAAAKWRARNRWHRRALRGAGRAATGRVGGPVLGVFVVAGVLGLGVLMFLAGEEEEGPRVLIAEVHGDGDGPGVLSIREAGVDQPLHEISIDDAFINFPRFSPDGSKVAVLTWTNDLEPDEEATMAIIDVATGEMHLTMPDAIGELANARWSPDSTRLAAGRTRLTIFDTTGNVVTRTDAEETAEAWAIAWSPGSDIVAMAGEEHLAVMSGDGGLRTFDLEALAEPVPAGVGLDLDRDAVVPVLEWDDSGRLRLIVGDRTARDSDSVFLLEFRQAYGFVRGTEVGWSSLQKLTPSEMEEFMQASSGGIGGEYRLRALTLVEGTDERYMDRIPAWETADGSAWVQVVPYGERDLPSPLPDQAKAVVFTEEPVVVELLSPAVPGIGTVRTVDVVVIPGE